MLYNVYHKVLNSRVWRQYNDVAIGEAVAERFSVVTIVNHLDD